MRSEVRVLRPLFLERLRRIIPTQKFDAIANTFATPKPTTFRINTLKVRAQLIALLQQKLERQGFRLEKISWYSDAFILRKGRLRDLEKTEIYQKGEIYVQSLSSMIPPLVLGPQNGEAVLDLTAAPGSKTTQIAALMGGGGEIVANESDRIRYEKLKANVKLQGAKNVEIVLGYGESIGKKFPECFNRVLLDAPCSAEGRFETREPSSYKYWDPKKIQEMAKLQKKLLASAIQALKRGGILVYSTCTFAPEENEMVIQDAIEKFNGIEIEDVGATPCGRPISGQKGGHGGPPLRSFPNQMSGLSKWEGKSFHASMKNTIRILPTPEMEAFFIARLHKKA